MVYLWFFPSSHKYSEHLREGQYLAGKLSSDCQVLDEIADSFPAKDDYVMFTGICKHDGPRCLDPSYDIFYVGQILKVVDCHIGLTTSTIQVKEIDGRWNTHMFAPIKVKKVKRTIA